MWNRASNGEAGQRAGGNPFTWDLIEWFRDKRAKETVTTNNIAPSCVSLARHAGRINIVMHRCVGRGETAPRPVSDRPNRECICAHAGPGGGLRLMSVLVTFCDKR